MDAVGPAGLYLSKLYLPINKIRRVCWVEQGAADFAVTRVMLLAFGIAKPGSKRNNRQQPRDRLEVPGPLPVRKFIRRRGIG